MSKFGAHITIGKRDGFGQALKACDDAGSPVPVIFAVDQNVWPDVAAYSPQTDLIFRTQPNGLDYPRDIYKVDPVASADRWFDLCYAVWALNTAHYYAPINEPNPATLDQWAWLREFDLQLMRRADQVGLQLALDGHTTGTPSDDGGSTRYDKLERMIPAYQHAKSRSHILLFHEYGYDKTLPGSAPHHALRYQSALDYLALFDADPQVVISECSDFNGYSGQGAKWLSGVKWYDQETINDKRVIGFCAYQLGGAENWYKLIPAWRDWVIANPQPIEPPDIVSVDVQINRQYLSELTAWVNERGGTVTS